MRRKSFTLVELLVVCVILGVVVVIAVPHFMNSYASSRLKVFDANIKEIKTALENYKTESGINAVSFYPPKLEDLERILTKTPVNPYTHKSMLTSTISAAGIFYKAIGSGANYVLMCAQRDIDDVDHDDNTKEVVPCNETISYNLITNNWTTNSVTFSGTNTIAAVAISKPNSAKQIINKQTSGTALFFHIRATGDTHVTVSLNEATLEVPVSTEWQKYAVVYDTPTDTIQIQFSNFPVGNNVYIRDVVLVDK